MYKWEADLLGARHVDGAAPARLLDGRGCHRSRGRRRRRPRRAPKLLFVANPNNPDGSVTPRGDLLRLLDLPLVVVVDEAYIDFSHEQSLAPLVRERDNLVVLRTFSKLAGMAGLRVGYGLFPLAIITHLWKVKQPYTPNVAGTVAALAALADRPWLAGRVHARGRTGASRRRAPPGSTGSRRCRATPTSCCAASAADGRPAR